MPSSSSPDFFYGIHVYKYLMLKRIRNIFFDHLDQKDKKYWPHLRWAVYAGVLLLYAGIASIIHALIPPLFAGTSERIVVDLARRATEKK
jgi:hypothetical protein